MKNNKSSAFDCISKEMKKAYSPILLNLYVDIFNLILDTGMYPSMWRENFIKHVFKGGDLNDNSCYKDIALSSCMSKLFNIILFNRIEGFLEK